MDDVNIAGGPFGFGTNTAGGSSSGMATSTGVPTFGSQRVTAGPAFDTSGVQQMTAEFTRLQQVVSTLGKSLEGVFKKMAEGSSQAGGRLRGVIDSLSGAGGTTPQSSTVDAGGFSRPAQTPVQAGQGVLMGGGISSRAGDGGRTQNNVGVPAPMGTGVSFNGRLAAPSTVRTSVGVSQYGTLGANAPVSASQSDIHGGLTGFQGAARGNDWATSAASGIKNIVGGVLNVTTPIQRYAESYLTDHYADMVDTDVLLTQMTRMQSGQFSAAGRQDMSRLIFGTPGTGLPGTAGAAIPGLASNYYSNSDLVAGIRTMMQGRGWAAPGTPQFANLMQQTSGISAMMPGLGFEGAAGLQSMFYSPQFHANALGLTGTSPLQLGGGTQDPREWAAGFLQQMFGGQQMQALDGMTEANIMEVFQPGTAAYAQAMAMSGGNVEFVNFLRETGIAMAQNGGRAPDWNTLAGAPGQGFGVDLSQDTRNFVESTNEAQQNFWRTLIPNLQEAMTTMVGIIDNANNQLGPLDPGENTIADGLANTIAALGVASTAIEELDLPLKGFGELVAGLALAVSDARNEFEAWTGRLRSENSGSGTGDGPGAYMGDSLTTLNRQPDPGGSRGNPTALSLHDLIHQTGVQHRISSVVRPGARTRHGGYSYHATGHALDIASPTGGRATYNRDEPHLANVYRALKPLKDQGKLKELIYGGPSGGGWRTRGTRDDHLDHVHVAATEGSLAGAIINGSIPSTSSEAPYQQRRIGVAYTAATASSGIGYSEASAIESLLASASAPSINLGAPSSMAEAAAAATTPVVTGGDNRSIGRQMAAARGWTGSEWDALEKLWTRESGWRTTADNPSSSAYGIPQALIALHDMPPGYYDSKTGHGRNTQGHGGNPQVQIEWGLNYIKQRFGSPSGAWAFWQRNHWYDGEGTTSAGGTSSFSGDGPGTMSSGGSVRMSGGSPVPSGGGGTTVIIQNAQFTATFTRASREEAEQFARDVQGFIEARAISAAIGGS